VSVKDNRDIEINEINELKERKKGKKEWRYKRSNFPLKFERRLPFEGN
jgi:hypothetical protein